MQEFEFPGDVEFDRLVDGALSDDEERALLARLDDVPDGWRRLALAFCEDRALRGVFAVGGPRGAERPHGESTTPLPAAAVRRRDAWGFVVIGLAALLVGLGTGLAWNGRGVEELAEQDVPALPDRGGAANAEDGESRFETLEMLVDDGVTMRRLQVPIVAASRAKLDWMDVDRPVVPAAVRRAFEEAGLEVAESRRFLRVPLDAEHDALVPVGEFSAQRVEYQ